MLLVAAGALIAAATMVAAPETFRRSLDAEPGGATQDGAPSPEAVTTSN
ncbi:hypothetical protein SSPO_082720 [Streptomyces antimycoticus]|uniref:Membrane transport protein MMPL domain-containing protein n=1 Tax=Streptomyces antimycoticus TaxID=68175 RepID=A0A499UUD6_9ACTN|nr:hypothetical protein [Streptomyces antimycoticus]BBJ45554.1 hypothetical protein SSPO_082720 [Streptomyces antimycoticus]